jgi:hypothetical protein
MWEGNTVFTIFSSLKIRKLDRLLAVGGKHSSLSVVLEVVNFLEFNQFHHWIYVL